MCDTFAAVSRSYRLSLFLLALFLFPLTPSLSPKGRGGYVMIAYFVLSPAPNLWSPLPVGERVRVRGHPKAIVKSHSKHTD